MSLLNSTEEINLLYSVGVHFYLLVDDKSDMDFNYHQLQYLEVAVRNFKTLAYRKLTKCFLYHAIDLFLSVLELNL